MGSKSRPVKKTLIIGNQLLLGGAEKLLYELVLFSVKNNIEPIILILDNYNIEHYDSIFSKMDIKVVRTRINRIRNFRKPARMLKSIIWFMKLRFFANRFYDSVNIIGLYNADKVINRVVHNQRLFWHVNNTVQFADQINPYQQEIFSNENDTIILINKYQIAEIQQQYGLAVRSKLFLFKLFINDGDTN